MRSSTPIDSSRSSASDHPLGSDEALTDDDEEDAEVGNDDDEEDDGEEADDEEDDGEEEARYRGGVRWRC